MAAGLTRVSPSAVTAEAVKAVLPMDAVKTVLEQYGTSVDSSGRFRCTAPENHNHGDRDASGRFDRTKGRVFCASQGCYGDSGLDAIGLEQRLGGGTFPEALERLASRFGVASHQAGPAHTSQREQSPKKFSDAALLRDGYRLVAEFTFTNELQKLRYESKDGKTFRWRHYRDGAWWHGDGGLWKPVYWNTEYYNTTDPIIEPVFGVEGEGKCEELGKLGIIAFSYKELDDKGAAEFEGRTVVLWPDLDEAGERYAAKAAAMLTSHTRVLVVPESALADLPMSGDAVDAIRLGWDAERIKALVTAATEFRIVPVASTEVATSVDVPPTGRQWPMAMDSDAFYGLAGEIVRTIEPHSEADLVGLLMHVLVAFGNMVGRAPYFVVGGAEHRALLFVIVVGATASRKGTAQSDTFFVIRTVDEEWQSKRVQSGLSSGEGLIWAVRDPIEEQQSIKEKGRVVDYQNVVVDPGERDKRLLAIEPEFGGTLRVIEREGSTLSAQIRQAWDSGDLRVLTKTKKAQATGAHISIIGHITRDELRKYLGETEQANGFANRFLWVCNRRSKLLPDGGNLRGVDLSHIRAELRGAVAFARTCGEMQRSAAARDLWHAVYPRLAGDRLGMFGAVTSRAEAQVIRLAMIYALMDKSNIIDVPHLRAALAVWTYCEDSARFIFGDALGDTAADGLLNAIRSKPEGMTRTNIMNHFGRNLDAGRVGRALSLLAEHGLVRSRKEDAGAGRPAERWFAVSLGTKQTNLTKEVEG